MKSASGGIGLTPILTIVFVVLKLTGVITWPWVWVLSPLWIMGSIAVAAALIFAFVMITLATQHRRHI